MAEPVAPAPAEERGTLDVRDRVVRRVTTQVVLEVPRTVARDGLLGRLSSAASPGVDVDLRGGSARVDVRVAVEWPSPVAQVAAEVRGAVLERVPALTGVGVASVDVTVEPVVPDSPADESRAQ